jgi:hypothetical protein
MELVYQVTDISQLFEDMVALSNVDVGIDQGKIYTVGKHTIFYFNYLPPWAFLEDSARNKTIISLLINLKKYSLVIADFSRERMGYWACYEILSEAGVNFIQLTYNPADSKPLMIYYPHYCYVVKSMWKPAYKKNVEQLPKKYKISCLNGNTRWHRIYNYILLKERFDISDFAITLYSDQPVEHDTDDRLVKSELSPFNITQKWDSIKHQFPLRHSVNNGIGTPYNHPAHSDSYINLVTETDMKNFYMTEKTWQPIASAQLFLVAGYQHIIAHLRDIGVDTFDDYIDHKYYDSEPNWQARLQKIHQVIEDLLSQDIAEIYNNTKQRRINNAEKFFNEEFGIQYRDKIISCITMLK